MENPNTWGPIEHAIAEALDLFEHLHKRGICTLSKPRTIADLLRERGLMKEDFPKACTSNEYGRCILPREHVGWHKNSVNQSWNHTDGKVDAWLDLKTGAGKLEATDPGKIGKFIDLKMWDDEAWRRIQDFVRAEMRSIEKEKEKP